MLVAVLIGIFVILGLIAHILNRGFEELLKILQDREN